MAEASSRLLHGITPALVCRRMAGVTDPSSHGIRYRTILRAPPHSTLLCRMHVLLHEPQPTFCVSCLNMSLAPIERHATAWRGNLLTNIPADGESGSVSSYRSWLPASPSPTRMSKDLAEVSLQGQTDLLTGTRMTR